MAYEIGDSVVIGGTVQERVDTGGDTNLRISAAGVPDFWMLESRIPTVTTNRRGQVVTMEAPAISEAPAGPAATTEAAAIVEPVETVEQ